MACITRSSSQISLGAHNVDIYVRTFHEYKSTRSFCPHKPTHTKHHTAAKDSLNIYNPNWHRVLNKFANQQIPETASHIENEESETVRGKASKVIYMHDGAALYTITVTHPLLLLGQPEKYTNTRNVDNPSRPP